MRKGRDLLREKGTEPCVNWPAWFMSRWVSTTSHFPLRSMSQTGRDLNPGFAASWWITCLSKLSVDFFHCEADWGTAWAPKSQWEDFNRDLDFGVQSEEGAGDPDCRSSGRKSLGSWVWGKRGSGTRNLGFKRENRLRSLDIPSLLRRLYKILYYKKVS